MAPTGRRGERRHGESQAGQQEDPVQPAAGARGPTLPHVQPQEHGEHPQTRSAQAQQSEELRTSLSRTEAGTKRDD